MNYPNKIGNIFVEHVVIVKQWERTNISVISMTLQKKRFAQVLTVLNTIIAQTKTSMAEYTRRAKGMYVRQLIALIANTVTINISVTTRMEMFASQLIAPVTIIVQLSIVVMERRTHVKKSAVRIKMTAPTMLFVSRMNARSLNVEVIATARSTTDLDSIARKTEAAKTEAVDATIEFARRRNVSRTVTVKTLKTLSTSSEQTVSFQLKHQSAATSNALLTLMALNPVLAIIIVLQATSATIINVNPSNADIPLIAIQRNLNLASKRVMIFSVTMNQLLLTFRILATRSNVNHMIHVAL